MPPEITTDHVTPGEKLEAVLRERGISQTDLGRQLGFRSAYDTVHKWTRGRGFSRLNRRRVESALGLRDGFFDGEQAEPAADAQGADGAVWDRFLATPIAESATPEELDAVRSMRLARGMRPTVAFYQSVLAAVKGLIEWERVDEVTAHNEHLDRQLAAEGDDAE